MASEIDGVRTPMSASGGRVVLLLLCALASAAVVSFVVNNVNYVGTTGIIVVSTSPDFVDHIVVAPHSPAALGGVRRFAAAMRDAAAWANPEPPAVDDILASELKVDRNSLTAQVRAAFGERLSPALLQPSIDVIARYQKFPTFPATELIATSP